MLNPQMQYNDTGLSLTEREEALVLKAYQDQGGVWTIGYGHTIGVLPDQVITREQAVAYLKRVWGDIAALPEDIELAGQSAQLLSYAIAGPDEGRVDRFTKAVDAFEARFARLPAVAAATPLDTELVEQFTQLLVR